MTDCRPGLVAGRFRLGGLLGSGGTASVFSARDERSGEMVAVKLLHPHLSRSELVRDAFLLEARRAARVSHPGIVSVIDLGTFEDHGGTIAWIAQSLLPGVSLAERVRESGALAVADAVSVVRDLLDALGAVHAAGVVHRDVSPANVMIHIDDDGKPRATLLDFGLADAVGATALGDDVLRSSVTAATSGVVANAEYASPEQLSGRSVGPAGDLYQAGGLLYFALTGRPPFSGDDRAALVRAHLYAPPPVPSVAVRGIPSELDRVVVRALLKEPGDRFTDAAEMRDTILAATTTRRPPVARTRVAASAGTRPSAPPDLRTAAAPAASTPPAGGAAPAGNAASVSDRSGPGGGTILAVVVLLAAVATVVPLVAGAGRAAPTSHVATFAPPTAATAPSPPPAPVVDTPAPAAESVVPAATTVADARAALVAAGFDVGDIVEQPSAQAAGTVLASDPPPGVTAPRGTAVRLVVASGSNVVPEVSGMDAAAAVSTLRAAGFAPTQTTVFSDRPAGTVAAMEPASGSTLHLGSGVTISLAMPQATPVSTTPTPSPTSSITPTPTVAPR
ncbi:PASTA domain-containing protein [Microbacterium sp. VKM Ac-2923]|uniref:protein kinase domain-containing protein n=1 Tax=Microbacterium sp. VKM Ac-2923 TaxID=2929476 RepID=UPI001FB1EF20|nr:PASTA domain-containing protein [Microbacterium sp. VKM Ac-2923]MCJ1708614.1 PASTA domain-containing protein [Microbacterium sp. VKM Ac-2923]